MSPVSMILKFTVISAATCYVAKYIFWATELLKTVAELLP